MNAQQVAMQTLFFVDILSGVRAHTGLSKVSFYSLLYMQISKAKSLLYLLYLTNSFLTHGYYHASTLVQCWIQICFFQTFVIMQFRT